jgi:hypothetical protein
LIANYNYDLHIYIYLPDLAGDIRKGGRLGVESWTELSMAVLRRSARIREQKRIAEQTQQKQHEATLQREKPRRRTARRRIVKKKTVSKFSKRRRKPNKTVSKQPKVLAFDFSGSFYAARLEPWKAQRTSALEHPKQGHIRYSRRAMPRISIKRLSKINDSTPLADNAIRIDALEALYLPQPSERYELIVLPAKG